MPDDQDHAQMKRILALDIGGTSIKSALFQNGVLLQELSQVASSSGGSFEEIAAAIGKVCEQAGDFDAAAAAIPGPFDYAKGISLMTHKFAALKDRCLVPLFGGKEVRFAHDANAFLLGEMFCGAGKGYDRVYGITLGTGLGAAFCEKGKLLCGPLGSPAPEVSLWNKPFRGGIIEDVLSTKALYAGIPKEKQNREFFFTAEGSRRFEAYTDALAEILAECQKKFEPELFVIGGQIARDERLFDGRMKEIRAVRSVLGTRAALYGAAALYQQTLFREGIKQIPSRN